MNTTIPISIVQTTPSGSPAADSNFRSQVSPGPRQGHASPSSLMLSGLFFCTPPSGKAEHTSKLPFWNKERDQKPKVKLCSSSLREGRTAFEAPSSLLNPLLNTHPLAVAGSPPHYPCPSAGGRWNSWLSISLRDQASPGAANTNQAGSRLPALQTVPATSCLPPFS